MPLIDLLIGRIVDEEGSSFLCSLILVVPFGAYCTCPLYFDAISFGAFYITFSLSPLEFFYHGFKNWTRPTGPTISRSGFWSSELDRKVIEPESDRLNRRSDRFPPNLPVQPFFFPSIKTNFKCCKDFDKVMNFKNQSTVYLNHYIYSMLKQISYNLKTMDCTSQLAETSISSANKQISCLDHQI